jgi:hypothetical protein
MKAGVDYYLAKMLHDKDVESIIIEVDGKNEFNKTGDVYSVKINYANLELLKNQLAIINNNSKIEKSRLVDNFFGEHFPKFFEKSSVSPQRRAKRMIDNLDRDIIEHLEKKQIDILLDFFEQLLALKYAKKSAQKKQLLRAAKIKVDEVAINSIIDEFEELLSEDPSEKIWGKFLKRNLFLVNSKYVNAISQLNVVLGSQRPVDFGLVDWQGYLDIFEIKKPSTPLLDNSIDRGNYVWSKDATRALVQAEKYLYNAERKAAILTEDVKRQKGIKVEVIRPRALLIIGTNDQLDNSQKREDFRILRHSLKNIEIILYDELLIGIKNQKSKIFAAI